MAADPLNSLFAGQRHCSACRKFKPLTDEFWTRDVKKVCANCHRERTWQRKRAEYPASERMGW